jgi:hypothetical protein
MPVEKSAEIYNISIVGFEVFIAVVTKSSTFWGYNAIYSTESLHTFRRNMSPLSSVWNKKPRKKLT